MRLRVRPSGKLALLAGVAFVFCAAAAVWAVAPRAEAGPNCSVTDSIDSEEQAFLTLINGYRQQNGQQPLSLSAALTKAASWKSQDMATNNYFAHDDLYVPRSWDQRIQDCGYNFNTWIGENIAAGNTSAADTFDQWRNSPGHNANMLSSNYAAIGIARAYNAGAAYGWYWTTDFGGLSDAAPATSTPPASPTPTSTLTPIGQPATPPATLTGTPTLVGQPATPAPTRTATAASLLPSPSATATRPLPPPAPRDPDGDVNCDGATNSIDGALVLQLAAHSIGSLPCGDAGDVNRDGSLNAIDTLIILQYAAGLINSLPV